MMNSGFWVSMVYPMMPAFRCPGLFGDQFLLREGVVWTLSAETGDFTTTSQSLTGFLAAAVRDPEEALQPAPLVHFCSDGRELAPGRLLLVYPAFCTEESAAAVSIKDVPSDELIRFHADSARRIANVEDGKKRVMAEG